MTEDKHCDARPLPPEKPAPDDCCRGGCEPCVFEVYAEQMQRYRVLLAQWEARQAARGP